MTKFVKNNSEERVKTFKEVSNYMKKVRKKYDEIYAKKYALEYGCKTFKREKKDDK